MSPDPADMPSDKRPIGPRSPSARVVDTLVLERALVEKGLLPPNCRLLEVVMKPMAALVLRYEVFVTGDDLVKFAAALHQTVQEFSEPT